MGTRDTFLDRPPLGTAPDQPAPLAGDELSLWKHFQKEADAKKQDLLNLATLHLGLLGAVVAFGVKEGLDSSVGSGVVKDPILLLAASAVGICLACLAHLTITELGEHVSNSWRYANAARHGHQDLDRILGAPSDPPRLPKVAQRLARLVQAFGVLFCIGVIVGVVGLLLQFV